MFQDPIQYNIVHVVNRGRTKDVLEKYHKYLNYGEKDMILDIGSGTGSVTSELLLPIIPHPNFTLIGIDISETFVDYANKNVSDPRVSFRRLDITGKNENTLKSAFKDVNLESGFDKIFSFSVISWVKDYEQTLQNVYTLLRPGGQILIWFIGYYAHSDIWHNVNNKKEWQPYFKDEPTYRFPFHHSSNAEADCTELLKRIGFQDIICDCVRSPQVIDLSAPWRLIVEVINPHSHKVPEQLRSKYFDDCMDMFDYLNEKTNGLPLDTIAIVASKPLV